MAVVFQGLSFYIDLDGAGLGTTGFLQQLCDYIAAVGGQVVQSLGQATHAVLRHKQQPAYVAAQQTPGMRIVPAQWVILSAARRQLQGEGDHSIYPEAFIPGFTNHVRHVTISGITGLDRAIIRYKVECTGAEFRKDMPIVTTSHVITTAQACAQPSKKIEHAARFGLYLIRDDWLDDCLSAWQHIAEGPYLLHLAAAGIGTQELLLATDVSALQLSANPNVLLQQVHNDLQLPLGGSAMATEQQMQQLPALHQPTPPQPVSQQQQQLPAGQCLPVGAAHAAATGTDDPAAAAHQNNKAAAVAMQLHEGTDIATAAEDEGSSNETQATGQDGEGDPAVEEVDSHTVAAQPSVSPLAVNTPNAAAAAGTAAVDPTFTAAGTLPSSATGPADAVLQQRQQQQRRPSPVATLTLLDNMSVQQVQQQSLHTAAEEAEGETRVVNDQALQLVAAPAAAENQKAAAHTGGLTTKLDLQATAEGTKATGTDIDSDADATEAEEDEEVVGTEDLEELISQQLPSNKAAEGTPAPAVDNAIGTADGQQQQKEAHAGIAAAADVGEPAETPAAAKLPSGASNGTAGGAEAKGKGKSAVSSGPWGVTSSGVPEQQQQQRGQQQQQQQQGVHAALTGGSLFGPEIKGTEYQGPGNMTQMVAGANQVVSDLLAGIHVSSDSHEAVPQQQQQQPGQQSERQQRQGATSGPSNAATATAALAAGQLGASGFRLARLIKRSTGSGSGSRSGRSIGSGSRIATPRRSSGRGATSASGNGTVAADDGDSEDAMADEFNAAAAAGRGGNRQAAASMSHRRGRKVHTASPYISGLDLTEQQAAVAGTAGRQQGQEAPVDTAGDVGSGDGEIAFSVAAGVAARPQRVGLLAAIEAAESLGVQGSRALDGAADGTAAAKGHRRICGKGSNVLTGQDELERDREAAAAAANDESADAEPAAHAAGGDANNILEDTAAAVTAHGNARKYAAVHKAAYTPSIVAARRRRLQEQQQQQQQAVGDAVSHGDKGNQQPALQQHTHGRGKAAAAVDDAAHVAEDAAAAAAPAQGRKRGRQQSTAAQAAAAPAKAQEQQQEGGAATTPATAIAAAGAMAKKRGRTSKAGAAAEEAAAERVQAIAQTAQEPASIAAKGSSSRKRQRQASEQVQPGSNASITAEGPTAGKRVQGRRSRVGAADAQEHQKLEREQHKQDQDGQPDEHLQQTKTKRQRTLRQAGQKATATKASAEAVKRHNAVDEPQQQKPHGTGRRRRRAAAVSKEEAQPSHEQHAHINRSKQKQQKPEHDVAVIGYADQQEQFKGTVQKPGRRAGKQAAAKQQWQEQQLSKDEDDAAKGQGDEARGRGRTSQNSKKQQQQEKQQGPPVEQQAASGDDADVTPPTCKTRSGSSSHSGSRSAAAAATTSITLSGMHSDERIRLTAILRRLKVRCQPQTHTWQPGTTHIVLPSLKRSEKTLAGMAAGAWLVSTKWVEDSGAAGKLLDPQAYELESGDQQAISEGAPVHWRTRHQSAAAAAAEQLDAAAVLPHTAGASAGLRVVFYGSNESPSFDTLARVLKAGGGQLLRRAPPYTALLPSSTTGGNRTSKKGASNKGATASASAQEAGTANLAVIGPDKPCDDKWVEALLSAGVMCVSPAYLVDWLAHPWQQLDEHRLFQCKVTTTSSSNAAEVAELEEARKLDGQQQQVSISF